MRAKVRGVYEHPKGTGVWWIHYYEHGRRHRERIGSYRLAVAVLEKRRTEIREGRYFDNRRNRTPLFDDLLDDYREWANLEGKAIINGQGCYERLLAYFGGKRADSIALADVERFKHELGERVSIATVNRNLTLLRAIFNRAIRHARVDASPMRTMKLDKENNWRRRVLSAEEEPRLIEALPERLWPLVLVAIHTGMRLGELLALTWRDVDLASGTITIREAKSGEGRIAWMSPVAAATLRTLRRKQIQDGAVVADVGQMRGGYVFQEARGSSRTCLWRYWQPALRKAGIENLHFHDLRHTFASRLVARGIDIYRVKTLMGHKTLRMTERYAHVADEHLREAVQRLAQ
jgi:integrase